MKQETGPLGIIQSAEIINGSLVVTVKPTEDFLRLHGQAKLEKPYGTQAN